MAHPLKTLSFSLVLSILSASAAFAAALPEGSFKGNSSLIHNNPLKLENDTMAFLVKGNHALLAEYDRVPLTNVTKLTALTKWVNRMYAYRIEEIGHLKYALKPLKVEKGEIVANENVHPAVLTLKKEGSLEGAVLVRMDTKTGRKAEEISLKGKVGSTWEALTHGDYYGTKARSGSDYFNKKINTHISEDGVVIFDQEKIKGSYQLVESVPGLFSLQPKGQGSLGADQVVDRIAVFIDIVNWKPVFTTEELLLVNPENAEDVGFYYERH